MGIISALCPGHPSVLGQRYAQTAQLYLNLGKKSLKIHESVLPLSNPYNPKTINMIKFYKISQGYLFRLWLLIAVLAGTGLQAQVTNVPGGGSGPAPGTPFNYRPLGNLLGIRPESDPTYFSRIRCGRCPWWNSDLGCWFLSYKLQYTNVEYSPFVYCFKEVGGPPGLTANNLCKLRVLQVHCVLIVRSALRPLLPVHGFTITLATPFYFTGGGTHLEVLVETNYGGGGGEAFNGKVFSRSNAPGKLLPILVCR
jgi:hypothetical protein